MKVILEYLCRSILGPGYRLGAVTALEYLRIYMASYTVDLVH